MSSATASFEEKMENDRKSLNVPTTAILADDTVEATAEYTPAQYRRLRIKTDLILMPILWAAYGLLQADKNSLSTQATFGIRQDTHLVGQQFSWLSTIFYLSYLVFEFPFNWLMQRVHVGRTIGACMILWGVIVLSIAFAKNFHQLLVLRFLQGALECSIGPAFLVITGAFFTTREHTLRTIIWGTGSTSFGAISDGSLYGIGRLAQKHGYASPWKGISFFLGGFTILIGILAFLCLGTPREVFWLSEDEKRMTAARVVGNQTGTDREKRSQWDWAQARECLRDPQTYFFFLAQVINALPNGGNTTFGNLVYVSFGFTPLDTLLKGVIPRDIFGFFLFVGLGFLTLKRPNLRFLIMMFALVPSTISMFLLAFLPNRPDLLWPKWGLYFMSTTGMISGLLIQTFIPSNVAGRTKRTVVLSVVFIAYCVGNSIGAQIFRSSDAPRYIRAITVCGCMYALEFTVMGIWRFYYVVENKRRNAAQLADGISEEDRERLGAINAERGMTDLANPHFRYSI